MRTYSIRIGLFALLTCYVLIFSVPARAQDKPTIQVVIPEEFQNQELIQSAATEVGSDLEINVEISFLPSGRTCMPYPPQWLIVDEATGSTLPDIILLESTSMLYVMTNGWASAIPDSAWEEVQSSINPFESAVTAFSSSAEPPVHMGVPVAANYAALIFDEDSLDKNGIEYPQKISWDELININSTLKDTGFRLGILNDPIISATLGLNASGLDHLLDVNAWNQFITDHGTAFNDLALSDNVYAGTVYDINNEINSKTTAVALTMTSALASFAQGDVKLGAGFLPYFNPDAQLSAGHAYGFVVSPQTANSDLAWQVVIALAENRNTTVWALSNGLLPPSEQGFSTMQGDPDMVSNFFPVDVNVTTLKDIASQSLIWSFPADLNPDFYVDALIPQIDQLTNQVVNSKVRLEDAMQPLIQMMKEMPQVQGS